MPTTTTRSSSRISVASAKAKGRKLQQWVRNYLQQHLKGVEDDDITSTPGGVNGPDIGLSPLARRLFPWTVECKARSSFAIYAALEQAETNCDGRTPVVVFKRNRSKTYVAIEFTEWLKTIK